ncbi:MAG: hypothetical protein AB7O55_24925 [Lautropia sp.]
MTAEIIALIPFGRAAWRWIRDDAGRISNIVVEHDGTAITTVTADDGVPQDRVLAAVLRALERESSRRKAAAQAGAQTRSRRQEKRVRQIISRLAAGEVFGPRTRCLICSKALETRVARQRGIGADCWQNVLAAMTREVAE